MVIVNRFPDPPAVIRQALIVLQVIRSGDRDAIAEMGDVHDAPRPWDPASCPPDLRESLWRWLDDVAAWLNAEYAWRPAAMIPGCWPRHPHITHELAVLACLRDAAQDTAAPPELLEEWHRHSLPMFLDRLATRLGESTCRTGRHQDWPAASRHDSYAGPAAARERDDLFHADTHPPTILHPVAGRA